MPLRKVGQIRPREDASPVTPEEPAPQRQREDDLIDLTSSDEELDEALSQIPLARPNDGLTDQQRDVVRAAKAPDDIPPGGEIIRVTAAAGTGQDDDVRARRAKAAPRPGPQKGDLPGVQ